MPPIVSTDWRRCIFPPNQLFLYFTTTKVIEKASNYKVLFNNVCRLAAAPLNCCKLRATRLASGKVQCSYTKLLLSSETILILKLTDRTDCMDFFAYAMCFSTTEMTDSTDSVSIACSLRYWPVTYPWRNMLAQIM